MTVELPRTALKDLDAQKLAEIVDGQWEVQAKNDWTYSGLSYGEANDHRTGQLLVLKSASIPFGVSLSRIINRDWNDPIVLDSSAPTPDLPNPILRVASINAFLDRLSAFCRENYARPIVAVTGSVGKSSTVELLCHLLSTDARVTSNRQRNFSEGVICSIANLINSDYVIAEVSGGAIGPASARLKPNVALLTHISPAHLDDLGTMDALIERKTSIFSHLEEDGTAILPTDISSYDAVLARAYEFTNNVYTFGTGVNADFRLLNYESQTGIVTAQIPNEKIEYQLGLQGRHMAINSLGALAACYALGISVVSLIDRLRTAAPVKGRGGVHNLKIFGKTVCVIDDSFNANPASMEAALRNIRDLAKTKGSRKTVVLTDMLELGENSKTYHLDLEPHIDHPEIDLAYLSGTAMYALWRSLSNKKLGYWSQKASSLLYHIVRDMKDGDVILIKGSHGSGAFTLVNDLIFLSKISGEKALVLRILLLCRCFHLTKDIKSTLEKRFNWASKKFN